MYKIDLNCRDIMSAAEAAKIWGKNKDYVRNSIKQNPEKWPEGSWRKFGKQWVVTTDGMETVTGIKDPRKKTVLKISTEKTREYL